MTTLTLAIVIVFVVGYCCIATESFTKIDKAPVALLMCVVCWTLYMLDPAAYLTAGCAEAAEGASGLSAQVGEVLKMHLGDAAETLFFLMGAMTIVEIVDSNGGFNFVRDVMKTSDKRKLLWRIAFMTFFLSAILDNLTTSIVMIMVLRKLIQERDERIIYASIVIIAANAGGAFSPIGDVTTIMLWIKGMITTQGVLTEIFIPSLISLIIPTFILQYALKGKLDKAQNVVEGPIAACTKIQRRTIFLLGVGGLIFVPIFRALTGLPPFMGILLVLGVLWATTEIFHRQTDCHDTMAKRVSELLSRIDLTTILFFLGILMAVSCLSEVGVLTALGQSLNDVSGGNHYLVTGIIGIISSIVDNVPLVAGCMGMYPIAEVGDMAVDGVFWQLLAFCAGTGGSILIIGSAAGVVVMGLEKITFGWYMRHVSWVVLVGYFLSIASYWLLRTFVFA